MNITIIAYREDHEEISMGHCIGGSGSDFSINYTSNEEEAAYYVASYLFEDHTKDYNEAEYDITILIDGIPAHSIMVNRIYKLAQPELDEDIAAYDLAAKEELELKYAEDIARKKVRELKQLKQLQEKYPK